VVVVVCVLWCLCRCCFGFGGGVCVGYCVCFDCVGFVVLILLFVGSFWWVWFDGRYWVSCRRKVIVDG